VTAYDDRQDLVGPAERVVDDGVGFWANDRPADGTDEPVTGRREMFDRILHNREEYRERYGSAGSEFREAIGESIKRDDLETMAGAVLYLAAAGYEDRGADSRLVGDRYDQKASEVASFVLELDRYSVLDEYSEDQIAHLIENEDDELHRLLEREVTDTRDSIQDLNVPESALENDREVSFLQGVLETRQAKMSAAVQQYVAGNTLYDILATFEEAVLDTAEAVETRQEIAETVETEIADLEDQIQWALRTQHERYVSELEAATGRLESELLSADRFDDRLDDVTGELQWAFREHREFLTEELQRRSDADAETLTSEDVTALLSEQRDDIVDSLEQSLSESRDRIDGQLTALRERQRELNDTIEGVERHRESVSQAEIETLIDSELDQLDERRQQLDALVDRLERERARLEAEVDSLEAAPTPPEPVDETDEAVAGSAVVPASVARLSEQDFLARIERSLRAVSELTLPDGETLAVDPAYWDADSRVERGSFQGALLSQLSDDARIRRYPERPWVRYATVESTGLLGHAQQTDLVVEGLTLTRLDTYADRGSDWAPATLSELHGVVGEALDRSYSRQQDDAHHLLVVGSPTGWRDRVVDEIEAGAVFDPDVSVCLVDLRTDERHFHDRDPVLRNNRSLFAHELPTEAVIDCAGELERAARENVERERIRLDDVVANLEYGPHVVKRAFDRLEDRGVGRQIDADRGLMISFDLA